VGADTITTGGSVVIEGGPLCISFAGDRATITNGEVVYVRVYAVSTGVPEIWYLWPGGTRADAEVFRRDGQLYFVARSGDLYWLDLSGLVIVEGPHGRLSMSYSDADELFSAEWLPR